MGLYRTMSGHPLGQLRQEFDRIFNDLSRQTAPAFAPPAREFPAVNIWETEHELFVEAEVPGLKREQLEIYAVGNELTLNGTRANGEPDAGTFHRRERGAGAFNRVVRLPVEVDPTKVAASLRNGILEVRLPKAEAAKPRKIEVQVAG